MLMAFARANSLSFLEVLRWHPRDVDTYAALNQKDAQDQRFEQLQAERQG